MPEYNVDAVWRKEHISSPNEVLARLTDSAKTDGCVFHGSHEGWKNLTTMLDIRLGKASPKDRLASETALLEEFVKQAWPHLPPGARLQLELPLVKWNSYRNSGSMFVARHFGLPTRSIDWTRQSLTALFFACRRKPKKDAVVWWMSRKEYERAAKANWRKAYGKTRKIEDDFEKDFKNGIERDVVVTMDFPPWMARPVAQSAFVTVSGRLGMLHDEELWKFGVRTCGRVVIPSDCKAELVQRLSAMGFSADALQIGESTIETIASDVSEEVLQPRTTGNA